MQGSFFILGLDEISIQSTTTSRVAIENMKCARMAVPIPVTFWSSLSVGGVRLANVTYVWGNAAILVHAVVKKTSQED